LTQTFPATEQRDWRDRLPLYLAGAAAAATVASIAAYQILLGLALLSLLLAKQKPRWLPVYPPLFAWIALTLISDAVSGHAAKGFPQIKKLYVWLMLLVVSTALRYVREIRVVTYFWAMIASLSSLWSMVQFVRKYRAAIHGTTDFYTAYIANRVTGFTDHWMTFSGEMMIALMMIGALVLFSKDRRGVPWLVLAGTIISAGILIAFTRSMWLGAALGGAFLLWMRKPVLILALPMLGGILWVANPFQARDRMRSIVEPRGDLDSNAHRSLTRRVGWEMIKAHPIFGVGPEQVGPQFESYVPADTPRPLPNGYYGHLHNIYYHYAAERGIPAMLALMWFLGRALFDFTRGVRRTIDPEKRWVLLGSISVIIAVMFSGYFELNLGDSEVLGIFLAVVSCGYVALLETASPVR
jgi:O-antigen ligase